LTETDYLDENEQMSGRKRTTRQPIVCGTDFSATASDAVDIAAAMARRLETKLVLVHVDQLLGALVSNPLLLEAAILQRRGDLDDEAQRLRDLRTNVEKKFLSGSAFDELVKAATKVKGRLIVLGAVGHGLAQRLLLGSVLSVLLRLRRFQRWWSVLAVGLPRGFGVSIR